MLIHPAVRAQFLLLRLAVSLQVRSRMRLQTRLRGQFAVILKWRSGRPQRLVLRKKIVRGHHRQHHRHDHNRKYRTEMINAADIRIRMLVSFRPVLRVTFSRHADAPTLLRTVDRATAAAAFSSVARNTSRSTRHRFPEPPEGPLREI